ncbi:6275_t:CDS:2 [Ambispora gerdemannii]|uniref:6275_t:CDS:1 n=1 Tax=Ambispora gerdemannii TaxID=144530 RepID=A0A9N9GC31_9GLOM|nr:6275_t:CDS:2 [Ambispora gerdemannii]
MDSNIKTSITDLNNSKNCETLENDKPESFNENERSSQESLGDTQIFKRSPKITFEIINREHKIINSCHPNNADNVEDLTIICHDDKVVTNCILDDDEKIERIPLDENNPMNWSQGKKRITLFLIAFAGIIAPLSSTILYPILNLIREDLNIQQILANSLVGVFILVLGIAPLGWASFSDTRGTRRNVYLSSFLIFIVASFICALSYNVWLLLIMRALQACGASAVQSIGAGTISDIYPPLERGMSFGLFYVGPLIGTVIGPVIGGYLGEAFGWRSIFWFLLILGVIIILVIFFFLPETFYQQINPSATSTDQKEKKRFNPFGPLSLLKHPHLQIVVLYISILYANLYTQHILISTTFPSRYHLSTSANGWMIFPNCVGYLIGSVLGGRYSDYVLLRGKKRHEGKYMPELRLQSVWFGAIIFSFSTLAFGWLVEFRLPLIWPLLAMFFVGLGTMLVVSSACGYMVDTFPSLSASAIATNNCMRYLAAATMTILTEPMHQALCTGWIFTILGFLSMVGGLLLVLVYARGSKWREQALVIISEKC